MCPESKLHNKFLIDFDTQSIEWCLCICSNDYCVPIKSHKFICSLLTVFASEKYFLTLEIVHGIVAKLVPDWG